MDAHWVVIGFLIAFALVAWWAKSQGREIQKAIDEAEGAAQESELKDVSNALRETAAAARTSGGRYADDRLSTSPLPDADYRD